MWPAVPMTVNKNMIGFAYGLINAANNIGLALYPFLFGYINEMNTPASYDNSILILIGFGTIGCLANISCYLLNLRNGRILD